MVQGLLTWLAVVLRHGHSLQILKYTATGPAEGNPLEVVLLFFCLGRRSCRGA